MHLKFFYFLCNWWTTKTIVYEWCTFCSFMIPIDPCFFFYDLHMLIGLCRTYIDLFFFPYALKSTFIFPFMPFSFHAQAIRSNRKVNAVYAHEFTDWSQGVETRTGCIDNVTLLHIHHVEFMWKRHEWYTRWSRKAYT